MKSLRARGGIERARHPCGAVRIRKVSERSFEGHGNLVGLVRPAAIAAISLPVLVQSSRPRLAASKGRLMRWTVDGSTPNCLAIFRTPGRPG